MKESAPAKIDLTSTDWVTAVSHYYRGEITRMNTWRRRLDVTTNWAIITTAAFLSFGFGSKEIPHFVIILATIFVCFFLIIEARRYKYFDLWRWRVAILNENFYACVFAPKKHPLNDNWRDLLSNDLQHSRFKINFAEAFGRRLRRNYSWIFGMLAFCWITKVSIHPIPVESLSEFFDQAAVYHILPGWFVILVGVIFNLTLFLSGLITMKKREEAVRIYPARKSKLKMFNI